MDRVSRGCEEIWLLTGSDPTLRAPVRYRVGPTVIRDGRFAYCDLVPDELPQATGPRR